MDEITRELEKILNKKNIYINESMKKHTSFRIGGIADYYVKIQSVEQLKSVFKLSEQLEVPLQIIGNGTNLLVRDGGIRGIVAKLELMDYKIMQEESEVYVNAGCGMALSKLAVIACENGLTGLEEISSIPGTLGGAVYMNAGAYGKEMKDIVKSSNCIDKNGNIYELSKQEHLFEHRKSAFENNGLILLDTTLKLEKGDKEKIQQKMAEYKKIRAEKQPLEFPNAGSIFKKKDMISVSKLIDESGLKGYSIGDAQISEKHAGFIVNKGNATANDVLKLTAYIQEIIKKKFGLEIELEVIVMGEDA